MRRPHCLTESFSNHMHEASGLCSLPCLVQRLTKASIGSLTRIRTIYYYYYPGNLAHRSLQHTIILSCVIRPPTRELRSLGLVPGACVCLMALFQHRVTFLLGLPWHRANENGFVRRYVRAAAFLGNLVLAGEVLSSLTTSGEPEIDPKELPQPHRRSWYGISKGTLTPSLTVLLGWQVPPGSGEGLSMVCHPS